MRINGDDRVRQDDAKNLFFKASETMESNSFHFCKCLCVCFSILLPKQWDVL